MNRLLRMQSLLVLLFVVKVVVSVAGSSSRNSNFRWYCDLDKEPIVELRWDPEMATYIVWDGTETTAATASASASSSSSYENNDNGGAKRSRRRRRLLEKLHDWSQEKITFLRGDQSEEEEDQEVDFVFREAALSVFVSTGQSRNLLIQSKVDDEFATTTTSEIITTDSNNNSTDGPSQDDNDDNNNNIVRPAAAKVLVRRCPCWNLSGFQNKEFFCPLPRTHCGIGAGWSHNPYNSDKASFVYEDPGCLDVERQQSFARNVWPVVTVWYLAMFMCLCLTRPGRHAIGYCISKIWPRWNVYATDRIIRQNPDHANRVVFRQMAQMAESSNSNRVSYAGFEVTFQLSSVQRPPAGAGEENNNNSRSSSNRNGEEFLLRTKRFRYKDSKSKRSTEEEQTNNNLQVEEETSRYQDNKQSYISGDKETLEISSTGLSNEPDINNNNMGCHYNHDENNEDDNDRASVDFVSCTICHMDIEDGERVGDLSCGHNFHIECLKSWIARRNVCPLCLAEDIATPRGRPPSSSEPSTRQSTTMSPLPDLVISGE